MLTCGRCAILLLFDPHSPKLETLLRHYGYAVALAQSDDHAAEICTSKKVEAVLIDHCCFAEPYAWSIASRLKRNCPKLVVLLLLHGPIPGQVKSPTAVDRIGSDDDVELLMETLSELVRRSAAH